MHTLESIDGCRQWVTDHRRAGGTVGLVPTMGNLHAGHLSLVDRIRKQVDRVVVSIFVNPLQFGPGEDFNSYPRTHAADLERLRNAGCDAVFLPPSDALYGDPNRPGATISVPALDQYHCAVDRPHFFSGVATVVAKLFNIVQPDVAIFGEKDYQQLQVIRTMVEALNIPVEIISAPIVREASGLAMSSRNGYLDDNQRQRASGLYEALSRAADTLITHGSIESATTEACEILKTSGLQMSYFNVADPVTLEPLSEPQPNMVILTAAHLDTVRLIDNIQIHNYAIVR